MIRGVDISNNNLSYLSGINFAPLHDPSAFVMMKASEGGTYKDRYVDLFYNLIHGSSDGRPDPDRMYGFYHFARPDLNNTPMLEAYNFLRVVRHHAGYAVFALDVEGGALAFSYDRLDQWVADWCAFVFNATGVKPMIYCSASVARRFKKAAAYDCGLWVAKWSAKKPTAREISPWPFWAIWQNSDGGGLLDTDYFNGNIDQWRAYCRTASGDK